MAGKYARLLLNLIIILSTQFLIAGAAGADRPSDGGIDVIWGEKILLSDGIKLNATVYMPIGPSEPMPAIVTITPYIGDSYNDFAKYFATNGYAYVVVDSRGRGNSEGHFNEPFGQEVSDGPDIVGWVAEQSWCDGQIGMIGASYRGYAQWATMKSAPEEVKTIVPAVSPQMGRDFPMWKNIWQPYVAQWMVLTAGNTSNSNLYTEPMLWLPKLQDLYAGKSSYANFLEWAVGRSDPRWEKWLSHPIVDDYWDAMNPTAHEYSHIDIPILTIAGIYDLAQAGSLGFYKDHIRHGPPTARANHYVVIGPWDHRGASIPKRSLGGFTVGDAGMLDIFSLKKQWYDWILKDGDKPSFLEKQISYYVTGKEEWRYADSLDSVSAGYKKLYLHPSKQPTGGLSSELPVEHPEPSVFEYDPLDTRLGNEETVYIEEDPTNPLYTSGLYGSGLIFRTDPIVEPIELGGFPRFTTWLEMNVPDTDLEVLISEVTPDGSILTLSRDWLRARHRNSLRSEELVEPGSINRFDFHDFFFFARRIEKGSRLQLVIRAAQSIYMQKNFNSGGAVAEETAADARTATISLFHDEDHPSFLEIPIASTPTSDERSTNDELE